MGDTAGGELKTGDTCFSFLDQLSGFQCTYIFIYQSVRMGEFEYDIHTIVDTTETEE